MKQNEFMAWLEGFLYDKVKLGAADINLINMKLDIVNPEGYNLGYLPSPYTYPGMQGIEGAKIKDVEFIKENYEELMMKYAPDVDMLNVIDEGMLIGIMFGETMFLTWGEVESFIQERKSYDEGNH